MEKLKIANKNGMSCTVLQYGGTIQSILFPVNGELIETILNYPSCQDYASDQFYLGAIVGRYCNRIRNGKFQVQGNEYQLAINNAKNHLHGGINGFNKQVWKVESHTSNSVALSYFSSDGEEGYPGNLNARVNYRVDDENSIVIDITATVDKPCPVNLTGHSYFNLNRNISTIDNHLLKVNAQKFLSIDDAGIPTGEISQVANSPFDLSEFTSLGALLQSDDPRIRAQQGIDHNYVLEQSIEEDSLAAIVYSPETNIQLAVKTNMPGLQVYTGNHLAAPFQQYQGLCLEPQYFPDSPNRAEFPSSLLMPNLKYHHRMTYQFTLRS